MLSAPNLSLPVAEAMQTTAAAPAVEAPNSTKGSGWCPDSSTALGLTLSLETDSSPQTLQVKSF